MVHFITTLLLLTQDSTGRRIWQMGARFWAVPYAASHQAGRRKPNFDVDVVCYRQKMRLLAQTRQPLLPISVKLIVRSICPLFKNVRPAFYQSGFPVILIYVLSFGEAHSNQTGNTVEATTAFDKALLPRFRQEYSQFLTEVVAKAFLVETLFLIIYVYGRVRKMNELLIFYFHVL